MFWYAYHEQDVLLLAINHTVMPLITPICTRLVNAYRPTQPLMTVICQVNLQNKKKRNKKQFETRNRLKTADAQNARSYPEQPKDISLVWESDWMILYCLSNIS